MCGVGETNWLREAHTDHFQSRIPRCQARVSKLVMKSLLEHKIANDEGVVGKRLKAFFTGVSAVRAAGDRATASHEAAREAELGRVALETEHQKLDAESVRLEVERAHSGTRRDFLHSKHRLTAHTHGVAEVSLTRVPPRSLRRRL